MSSGGFSRLHTVASLVQWSFTRCMTRFWILFIMADPFLLYEVGENSDVLMIIVTLQKVF